MDDAILIANLLDQVPVRPSARTGLIARMSESGRHYHGAGHLALLWRRHLLFGAGSAVCEPPWHRLIACAIAFHDAVYEPARRDNEMASAALWRSAAPDLEPWEIDWVAGTILATANHLDAMQDPGMDAGAWRARLWMLDLDLTPLGEAEAEFAANTARLRAEYMHLDDAAWASGRAAFLRGLSRRPVLFRSPALHATFESRARANLDRELESST